MSSKPRKNCLKTLKLPSSNPFSKLPILAFEPEEEKNEDLAILFEEELFPELEFDSEILKCDILDSTLIQENEYESFWPLHPYLSPLYEKLLEIRDCIRIYEKI